jgi:hypothetical protein
MDDGQVRPGGEVLQLDRLGAGLGQCLPALPAPQVLVTVEGGEEGLAVAGAGKSISASRAVFHRT